MFILGVFIYLSQASQVYSGLRSIWYRTRAIDGGVHCKSYRSREKHAARCWKSRWHEAARSMQAGENALMLLLCNSFDIVSIHNSYY